MGLLVTIHNKRSAAFPVEEKSYAWTQGQPQAGEHIHLHDQGRLVRVESIVWMAQDTGCSALIAVVMGTDPSRPWDGRYA